MFDKLLADMILKQRGQNQKLASELENISSESKERLYRILQDLESRLVQAERKSKHNWI